MSDPRVASPHTPTSSRVVTSAQRDAAARAFAQWHLGDESWWDTLQSAAADPDGTLAALEAEGMNVAEYRGAP